MAEAEQLPPKLDELDLAILAILTENPRLNAVAVSKQVGVPDTTVHFRIEKMKEKGLIKLRYPNDYVESMVVRHEERISRVDADVGDQWRMMGTMRRKLEELEERIRKLEYRPETKEGEA